MSKSVDTVAKAVEDILPGGRKRRHKETCDDHLDSVRSYAKSVGVDVGSMAGWSVSCTHGEKGRKDYMYHPPAPAKAINSRVKVIEYIKRLSAGDGSVAAGGAASLPPSLGLTGGGPGASASPPPHVAGGGPGASASPPPHVAGGGPGASASPPPPVASPRMNLAVTVDGRPFHFLVSEQCRLRKLLERLNARIALDGIEAVEGLRRLRDNFIITSVAGDMGLGEADCEDADAFIGIRLDALVSLRGGPLVAPLPPMFAYHFQGMLNAGVSSGDEIMCFDEYDKDDEDDATVVIHADMRERGVAVSFMPNTPIKLVIAAFFNRFPDVARGGLFQCVSSLVDTPCFDERDSKSTALKQRMEDGQIYLYKSE